jgi:hypothetical protein
MNEELLKYILNIFITCIIIFGIITIFSIYDIKLANPVQVKRELKEVVTIESMITDNSESFCKNHDNLPSSNTLNKSCSNLTNTNCKKASCCVLLNGEKCLAGDISGPTFKTNTDGTNINVDFYYYKNKCYGNCPTK